MTKTEIVESGQQLVAIIERIEAKLKLTEQIACDIKAIYNEAKSAGFEPKYIKKIVALRKLDPDELDEQDEVIQLYRSVIGL